MKIKDVKTFIVDGGHRPWIFVKIETDEGLAGWGDASDWDMPEGVAKAVEYFKDFLIGDDPMDTERIWWKCDRIAQRFYGGIAWKAMAGIDTACYDIKGKALGVPVWQLLGGKMRDELKLYWSHCGSARVSYNDYLHKKPIRTLEDFKEFAHMVKDSGFKAAKLNLMPLEGTPLFGKGKPAFSPDAESGAIDYETVQTLRMEIGAFREIVGPDFGIALDTAFNYRNAGALKLARALEEFDMMWFETESHDPQSMKLLREGTRTPICHGESLYGVHRYYPYLQLHAQDYIMIDLAWNGLTMGKKVADLAHLHDTPVSPHNCHSPLTTFVAANLCATLPNFFICEIDMDDVPWHDDLLTDPYSVKDGKLAVPSKPGLGTEMVEKELTKHAGWRSFHLKK
jgi:L-alanine-DL-glutamate epimerase-like enolase superfamily enzyme